MTVLTMDFVRGISDEGELRQRVIMPLLRAMGFRDVDEWHGGPNEIGKDVVGWRESVLGRREYTAVVAKVGTISGAHETGLVASQINQAFGASFPEPGRGDEDRRVRVHTCWALTNGKLSKDAKKHVLAGIAADKREYVEFIPGDTLWELVERNLPIGLYQLLDETRQRIEALAIGYDLQVQIGRADRPFAAIEGNGIKVVFGEQYPGQLGDKSFAIHMTTQFPDDPDGRSGHEAVISSFKTGSRIEVAGEYVELSLPAIVDELTERLLGIKSATTTRVELGPAGTSRPAPARIDIETDDGDKFTLPYVDWRVVQAGTDELTLCNEAQPIPILVTHVINHKERSGHYTFELKASSEPLVASWLYRWLQLQRCFTKPCRVRITSVEFETVVSVSRREATVDTEIDLGSLAVAADLAAIQERIGQAIFVPEREFAEEDQEVIRKLRRLLRRPSSEGTWARLVAEWPAKDVEAQLENFLQGECGTLRYVEDEEIELFGARLSLGPVQYICERARLINGQKVREQVAFAADGETAIEVLFEPGESDRVTLLYLNWEHPTEDSAR